MARLLRDDDLLRCLRMPEAIQAIEEALAERRAGTAISHPRTHWSVGRTGFTVTPGGFQQLAILGMRVYLTGGGADDQLTVVWSSANRHLEGIIVGSALGAVRTGAMGGVAYKWMAPPSASSVAVIGGGPQSRTQLLALRAVRPKLDSVRYYRRDPGRRKEGAAALSAELGIPVAPTENAETAVRSADTVILATDSPSPVIRAEWLRRGAHVSSLGPKYIGRSEIGRDLLDWADELVCDFPEEYRRDEEFILHGTRREQDIRDLAAVTGGPIDRPPDRNTVFLSHGLAGTEVAIAFRALANARRLGIGMEISMRD